MLRMKLRLFLSQQEHLPRVRTARGFLEFVLLVLASHVQGRQTILI